MPFLYERFDKTKDGREIWKRIHEVEEIMESYPRETQELFNELQECYSDYIRMFEQYLKGQQG